MSISFSIKWRLTFSSAETGASVLLYPLLLLLRVIEFIYYLSKYRSGVLHGIVGGFLRDLDIVGMALLEGSGRDLDELAFLLKLFNVMRACKTHTAADTAAHLEDNVLNLAFIGYAAFDAFGNKLLGIFLEVSVLTALSSQPASMEPIMQTLAPAARALVISPENLMPPSAMTGIP